MVGNNQFRALIFVKTTLWIMMLTFNFLDGLQDLLDAFLTVQTHLQLHHLNSHTPRNKQEENSVN